MPSAAIRIHGPATEQEATAITIAIERFLAETTPDVQAQTPAVNPWFRAGLLEATGNEPEWIPTAAESGLNT